MIVEEISYKRGKSFASSALGEVLVQEGDLPAAQTRIEEAAATRELQEHDLLAQSRSQLAMIALQKGRLVDAEKLAREAVEQFERDKSFENAAWAKSKQVQQILTEAASHGCVGYELEVRLLREQIEIKSNRESARGPSYSRRMQVQRASD